MKREYPTDKLKIVVNGTLMRGFALNQNLLSAGAVFLQEDRTAPVYRLWSIHDQYPAMQKDETFGNSITCEIWEIGSDALVRLLDLEPPGLSLGKIKLQDGSYVFGILGESCICKDQLEITEFGGWREYQKQFSVI